jgi:hypothetical protein
MATTVPQPPPMAFHPRRESGGLTPLKSGHTDKLHSPDSTCSNGPSPFSPTTSTFAGSPATSAYPKSPSLDSHRALGIAVSEKSSFSSTSSGPSSPASLSYSPAVQSALRDSCRSSTSSHRSAMASPQSLTAKIQRDVEKQQIPAMSSRQAASERTRSGHHHASSYSLPDVDDDGDLKIEDKAMRILVSTIATSLLSSFAKTVLQLYLSSINCFVSFIILMYTILALLVTVLLQPFRLCTSSTSFRQHIIGFLAPTLKIQLAFIYSVHDADEYSAPMLVLVSLLSPLLSLGVAGGAWIAAAFWFFNAILGDPDGSDKPKGYNDGRASVMGVRSWWETWLRRPLR